MADMRPLKLTDIGAGLGKLEEFGATDTLPKAIVGLGNVDNTSDVGKPVSVAQAEALLTKEPAISADTVNKFWAGTKMWRDLATDVRASVLTGLSTATATAVVATDTVLAAFSKIQGRLNLLGTAANATVQTSTTDTTAGALLTVGASAPHSLTNLPMGGSKNKIINGKMGISQRGTTFAAATSGAFSLDRWGYFYNVASVVTLAQVSDAPSGFSSSLRCTVTSAGASPNVGESADIRQVIEGFDVRDLLRQTFTLSFWVRSSKVGLHTISMTNRVTPDRSYLVPYTVLSANTWEFKTHTVVGGLPATGTWDFNNGAGLQVRFSLFSGANKHGATGSWLTGNFHGTSGQVNCLDTVGNIFAITGVQLEVGAVATAFEHRPYGQELALCQRYYEPAVASIIGAGHNTQNIGIEVTFKVTKRAVPSIVQLTNNYRYSQIGVSTTTSSYLGDERGVAVYRAASLTGAVQFSELLAASAEP